MGPNVALGIDLGGTKIEAVALDMDSGKVACRKRVPTERDRGYESIVERTAVLVEQTASEAALDPKKVPIGIGMPGNVRRDGRVKNSNTVCLNGRPFREDLSARLGRPVVFDNDANCFALAEALMGAGAAYRDGAVFGVIMGTGVGGGLVFGGRIWSGIQGIAGEWGHHAVGAWRADRTGAPGRSCYCGHTGCTEQYLSGPAVEADYARRSGARRPLSEIAGLRNDDPHARAAIEDFLDYFGRALANVIDILDPSAVVLGGGVSNLDFLYEEGVARIAHHVFNDELLTPILKNQLGDSAGVFGAALLARGAAR